MYVVYIGVWVRVYETAYLVSGRTGFRNAKHEILT